MAYTDIQDGLVVNTMAGYPMKFLKYPNFTINGNVVLIGDICCTNGIAQIVDSVPDPLVPRELHKLSCTSMEQEDLVHYLQSVQFHLCSKYHQSKQHYH